MRGEDVKALRLKLGATYQGFADTLGVWKATIQNWEAHGVDGLPDTVLRLIEAKPKVWEWLRKHQRARQIRARS
jgi:DNA-binding transcriptional regulator YiaG